MVDVATDCMGGVVVDWSCSLLWRWFRRDLRVSWDMREGMGDCVSIEKLEVFFVSEHEANITGTDAFDPERVTESWSWWLV